MKRYTKTIVVSAVIAALAGLAVTGCGQARPEGGAEQSSEPATAATAVTEAVIIIQTEAPVETEPETEPETQPVTEVQTEPQTQPETTPPTEAVLSADEELAQENGYNDWVTMYANADINVRETPTTDNQDNIISSYDRGEEAVIIGETVNWYKIYKEYDPVSEVSELVGFVKKEFMSASYEEAMTERTEQPAQVSQTPETAAPQTVTPETTAPAETAQAAPEPAPAASTASGPSVTLNTDANIRSEAYETASVVGVVTKGTTVTQIGSSDGWVQIDYNGTQGYVKSSFVG